MSAQRSALDWEIESFLRMVRESSDFYERLARALQSKGTERFRHQMPIEETRGTITSLARVESTKSSMNEAQSDPRVLLIEDEANVAGTLRGMLSTLGYAVAGTTTRLEEVIAILNREPIDAAVLDIDLNGEASYPIADELAARGIPFIFSTGYGAHSLPAGYERSPLLTKPFRRSALGGALASLLTAQTA